mgnify:CR=1 FL=1
MDAGTLRNFLKAVNEITDEATLWVEDGRLMFRSMDAAHIVLVELGLSTEGCEIDGHVTVNIADLEKSLRHVNDDIGLRLENKRLKIFNNSFTATLNILSDTDYRTNQLPKLHHECEAEVEFANLKQAVEHAELFSDHLKLVATQSALTVKAKNDYGELERNIPVTGLKTEKDTVSASFSIPYLLKINKILKNTEAENIKLAFASSKPLEIHAEGLFTAAIFLAPRIE